MAKVISIGNQSFESIREKDNFYIDKTNFIREWWDNDDTVTLITRPRRFGKTLNMSMLECFFSNKYKDRGDLFEGLEIWNDEKYRKLQGTYPVIFLSFAGIKQVKYNETVIKIKDELIRILTSSLTDDNLIEESPDNVAGIIKDVDEYLFQEHADKCKILISQNDERIENWTNLRKEEFILSIKDSSEIDDLRSQYQNETNFKEKIAIKKRIDELSNKQKDREQNFHKTVGIIEKEAQDMKVQFEKGLLKRPVLFTKIVIKF